MGVPVCAFAVKGIARRINAVIETEKYQSHLESELILNAPRRRSSNCLTFGSLREALKREGMAGQRCDRIRRQEKIAGSHLPKSDLDGLNHILCLSCS
jgi:hypothetical protein